MNVGFLAMFLVVNLCGTKLAFPGHHLVGRRKRADMNTNYVSILLGFSSPQRKVVRRWLCMLKIKYCPTIPAQIWRSFAKAQNDSRCLILVKPGQVHFLARIRDLKFPQRRQVIYVIDCKISRCWNLLRVRQAPEADLPTSQSGQWQSLPREHLGRVSEIWVWVINETTSNWTTGERSLFPFTRVPFWGYPIFDPQPFGWSSHKALPDKRAIFPTRRIICAAKTTSPWSLHDLLKMGP